MKGKMIIAMLKKGKKPMPSKEPEEEMAEEREEEREEMPNPLMGMKEMLSEAFDKDEPKEEDSRAALNVNGMVLKGKEIVEFVDENRDRLLGEEVESEEDTY